MDRPAPTADVEFDLAPWRRALSDIGWWNLAQAIVAFAFLGMVAAALAIKAGAPPKASLLLGGAGAVAALGWSLARDLEHHAAGLFRIEGGRLMLSESSRHREAALTAIRFLHWNDQVLAIHLRNAPSLVIHQARLRVPLADVRAALFDRLGISPPADQGSWRAAAGGIGEILRARWRVVALVVAMLAALEWLARP